MSKNHNYLEAAQDGNLARVQFYAGLHPAEVDLNYQDAKRCSALHRAVQAKRNSQVVVKFLIEAGIDCGLRNEQNQTAAEMARHLGRGDLMVLMLEWEFHGVPKREIFYQLLRRNSMEMVCVYTVQWKLPFDEAIRSIEEAYEALRMKGVQLEIQTQYEIYQELIKHYGAFPTTCRRQDIGIGKDELLEYIDFVLQSTDESCLTEISDEVLMAMREIVKQIYLGKDRYDEAMMEVQHCLCAFVIICDKTRTRTVDFNSLIINKQLVLNFLRLVSKQLRQGSSKLSSRDRKTRKLLSKTFILLKEWNSIMKIVHYLTEACTIDLQNSGDIISKQLFMDRCVQVVGEAIKSTKLSPNLSNRMAVAFEIMTSGSAASCYKNIREFHSHGYPVAKYLLEKENDFNAYVKLQENFKTVLSFFQCMQSILMTVIQKWYIGLLYKMQTVKQIRSLAMFVDERVSDIFGNAETHQETFYTEKMLIKLIEDLRVLLKEHSEIYNILQKLEQQLTSHFDNMSKLRFNHLQMGRSFGTFLQAARTCQTVTELRGVLKLALVHMSPKQSIEICSHQRSVLNNQSMNFMYHLLLIYYKDQKIISTAMQLFRLLDCSSVSGLDKIQLKQANEASDDYVEEILRDSGAYDHYKNIPSNIRQNLRRNVEKNVFDVAERFRILALPESSKLKAYRQKQEAEFQAAFDRKISRLKHLMVNSAKPTGSNAFQYNIEAKHGLPSIAAQAALLEICEILFGVGAIKVNLHQLDNRIPILIGKNLRDSLAHDFDMYDVICENPTKYICNAVYYGTLSFKLYDRASWPKSTPFTKEGFNKLHDKLRWFQKQQTLYEQLKDVEKMEFNCSTIDKPDIFGCRMTINSDFSMYQCNAFCHALRYNMTTFIDHIDGTRKSRRIQYLINEIGHPLIPRKSPNQLSFSEKAQTLLNITLELGDFTSYREVTQKYNATLTYDAAYKRNPEILNHIKELNLPFSSQMLLDSIQSGNMNAFKLLLQSLDKEAIRVCNPLNKALVNGQLEMAKNLLKIVIPNVSDGEIAVVYKFDELLPQILPHVHKFSTLYKYAVIRDNVEAIKLMEQRNHCCIKRDDLLSFVAIYNRTSILEYLLQNNEWRQCLDTHNENGRTPLEIFAQHGNYVAVKLISEHSKNIANAIRNAAGINRNKIVRFLLRCNPHLISELLLDLIDQAIETKNNTLLKYLLKFCTDSIGKRPDLSEQFLKTIMNRNIDAMKMLDMHPLSLKNCESQKLCNAYHLAVEALSTCAKADRKLLSDQMFNLLAAYKIDPCHKDKTGMTPINRAITFRNLDLVRRLHHLDFSAINEPDAIGRTPLINALITNNLPIVRFLAENGANTNDLNTFRYPLHTTNPPISHFLEGHIECLEYAVKKLHLDLELQDNLGRTLLHELCRTDNLACARYILEQCHVNFTAQDIYGETALHHAIRYGSKNILDYILRRSDRQDILEMTNAQGQTALMLAISNSDRMPMANKLVMAGASKERLLQMIAGTCQTALEHLKM